MDKAEANLIPGNSIQLSEHLMSSNIESGASVSPVVAESIRNSSLFEHIVNKVKWVDGTRGSVAYHTISAQCERTPRKCCSVVPLQLGLALLFNRQGNESAARMTAN